MRQAHANGQGRPVPGPAAPAMPGGGIDLRRLRQLLGELGDLKRIVSAQSQGWSVAGQGFERAWRRLLKGDAVTRIACAETALACAAARLGPLQPAVLLEAGLDLEALRSTLGAAVRALAPTMPPALNERLIGELAGLDEGAWNDPPVGLPPVIELLTRQPRAGATRPGYSRLILEPAESHAEHCYVTAVIGALLAMAEDADPGPPFLLGLAHHLHNAHLPDAGFTGEELLGEHLLPLMDRLTERGLSELPPALAREIREVRGDLGSVGTSAGRCFNAADVLDRVLEMAYHARAASFELRTALDDLDLVHPGPLLAFQQGVLERAGLHPC